VNVNTIDTYQSGNFHSGGEGSGKFSHVRGHGILQNAEAISSLRKA